MKKVWRTEKIETSKAFKIDNVYEVTLNNYSNEDIIFQNDGVERILPKIPVSGVPYPFKISIKGGFNLDIKIKFPSGKGVLIIDYSVKKC